MATSTGKTNRCTAMGISNMPNSLRVPPHEKRRVEETRPASIPFRRCVELGEEVLHVIGRLDVPGAQEIVLPRVPELVRLASLEGDCVTRPAELLGPVGTLVADPSSPYRHGLILEVVHMHRRTGTRCDDVLHLQAVALRSRHDAEKSDALSGAVLDDVRIGVRPMFGSESDHKAGVKTRLYQRNSLPGFIRLSGSSARLIAFITSSASPCSSTR